MGYRLVIVSTPVFRLGGNQGLRGYGGLEAIAWFTAKGLAERGHEVALVAPDGSECPGCQIIACGPEGISTEEAAYQKFWKMLPQAHAIIDSSWQKWSYALKAEGVLKAPVLGVCHAPINTMFQSPPPIEKPCIVCISEDQKAHYEALYSPRQARV